MAILAAFVTSATESHRRIATIVAENHRRVATSATSMVTSAGSGSWTIRFFAARTRTTVTAEAALRITEANGLARSADVRCPSSETVAARWMRRC